MTESFYYAIFQKYRNGRLIVDANLLLLYLVGNFNAKKINTFKRTQNYTYDDYLMLRKFVGFFTKVVTTPNILTEVSNLSFPLNKQNEYKVFPAFRSIIQSLTEEFVESLAASEALEFTKFGLTDAVIAELAKKDHLILTDDFPLYNYLQLNQIDVINFNHIRSESWLKR